MGEFILNFVNVYAKEKQNNTLNAASFVIAQNVQQQITMGILSTSTLESMLRLDNFKTNNFENWAKEIIKNTPSIKAVQLAPNGIIKYIYPLKNHEKAIGHNLLSDPKRIAGALRAIERNGIIFIGPIKLIQNQKLAVIVRKPISKMKNGKSVFWGFSTTILYISDILEKSLHGLDKSKLAFKLYGNNPDFPDSTVIMQSKLELNSNAKSYAIKVPNAHWHLVINYIEKNSFNKYIVQGIIFILAFLTSCFIFYLEKRSFTQKIKLQNLNKSLKKMANTDILTQLSNRRSALDFMKKYISLCKREKSDFSLCFFDIDFFKKVNDSYGHEVGDLVLQHLSNLCENSIRNSDMFARWGGEEFILILPMTNKEGAYIICENLRKLINNTDLLLNKKAIKISVSIGLTSLENKEENIDDLLQRVDRALYKAKENGRNQTILM